MSSLEIRRPEAIDTAWLTRALQSVGLDAVVAAFEAKPVGTGQIGDSIRFKLSYDRGGDTAPATLVGKFPAADAVSFQAGVSGGNYAREVMFYRHLAGSALVSTPRCYAAELDEASGEFVLLMEDLAPAEQGDQLRGVSLQQARLVVDEAAKLHGSHWGDESLEANAWILATRASATPPLPVDFVQTSWRGFRERYGARIAPGVIEAGALLSERLPAFRALFKGPRCLIHNDFRPDNMMFATPRGGRPVTVLDWQSVALGAGPVDLAYFLAGALAPEVRRAHETELLSRYHQGLQRLGVAYDAEALRRDYAGGGFRLLMTAFVAAMRVKRTERGDAMFMQMAGAAAEHIHDHDALRLLERAE
jgi:aminoglycoside phosphotransferase (APT) family kinase protein